MVPWAAQDGGGALGGGGGVDVGEGPVPPVMWAAASGGDVALEEPAQCPGGNSAPVRVVAATCPRGRGG